MYEIDDEPSIGVEDRIFFARVAHLPDPIDHPRLRLMVQALLTLLFLAVVLFTTFQVWVRIAMYSALPQIEGTLHVAGLTAPVIVQRDHHGIPHIHASTQDDLFFAQGYVTAQDRLWQMDMLRRHGAGELAEVFGASALSHDRMQRILQMRHTADVAAEKLDTAQRRWLDDYARGVNAFIDSHTGAKGSGALPAEFQVLHYAPQHWQVRDTLLLALVMAQDLSTGYPNKLARERVMAKLPPELSGDLYPVGSWRDHPPMQPATDLTQPQQEMPDIPLDESQSRMETPKRTVSKGDNDKEFIVALNSLRTNGEQYCDGCRNGSNNWVVAGAHTASKMPMLANDMHLAHSIPNIWYIADLEAPGFHAAGVTLPGAPFVIVGHNDKIAWGFTNVGADVQDLYVEQTNGQNQAVITDPTGLSTWVPIEHRKEVIHIRGRKDEVLDVRVTAHGPIISPLIPHEKRDIGLKWIVYQPGAISVPFYEINTAQNWQEFCTAFAKYGSPAQNAVYGDTSGHIGYHAVGWVPNRPNGLNAVPVISKQGRWGGQGEWQGIIPFDQMPNVYDPPEGVLATANARVSSDDDTHPLTLDWENPYRNERIWKQLQGRNGLRREDMLALQDDTYSDLYHELAQRYAYAIDHTAKTSEQLKQAADILRKWNGNVTMDSTAPAIVSAANKALWPLMLRPKLGDDWAAYSWGEKAYVQEELIVHEPARWLPQQYINWDAMLTTAVQDGLIHGNAPENLQHWHWGNENSLEIKHQLWAMLPLLGRLTHIAKEPQSGNSFTVKAVSGRTGPSERMTADLSNWDLSTLNIVVGESGNPYSYYYRDQWPYWYGGATFTLPFSDKAVAAATHHTLVLAPAGASH